MAAAGLRIVCDGENANAEVYVNEKFKGECPLDMQLTEGKYKLRIQKQKIDDEYESQVFEQEVRLGDGVLKKIEVQLGTPKKICPECPDMVVIPAGSFEMGLNGKNANENPQHRVNIKAFAMSKTEITKGQFSAFVNATNYDTGNECRVVESEKWNNASGKNWRNPGYSHHYNQTDNDPVTCINWNDAKAYANWLSRKTGKTYQLPSEAQWEYACRAGGSQEYCGSGTIDSVAWHDRDYGDRTQAVARKQANAFGLYDMSGNVWEWTEDSYHGNYNGAPTDGSSWQAGGEDRMIRGGSWISGSSRAAARDWQEPAKRAFHIGFRLVRLLP